MSDMTGGLKERLNAFSMKADKIYREEEIESRINQLAEYYDYGHVKTGKQANPYDVHVNMVYPDVRTGMATMYAKRPEIFAKGRRAQDSEAARRAEVFLNYLTRHLQLSAELREWLFWARLTMYGCIKLGMEKKDGLTLPTFRAMDPRSVRVDPTPDRFRPAEGQWQKFRFRRSIAQLDQSGKYDQKSMNALRDQIADSVGSNYRDGTTDVLIWEHFFYDYEEGKPAIYFATEATGVDQPQRTGAERTEKPWSDEHKVWLKFEKFSQVIGLPGRFLAFIPSPKRWYPCSPVEMWLEMQKILNGVKTQQLIHVERSNRKRLYDVNKFSPEELAKLEDPNPLAYIGASGGDITNAIIEEPLTEVNPDLYRAAMEAQQAIEGISGIGSAQRGTEAPETGSTSATRDAIVQNNLSLRASDNQEIWEDALESAYQGLLNLAQDQMKGELYLNIVGGYDMKMSREDIMGDIDVILSFGSTLPTDREKEWERAKEVYQLLLNNPSVNQVALTRFLLQKEGDIKNPDQLMIPQMPPPGMPPGPMGVLPGMPPGPPPGLSTPQALASISAQQDFSGGASPLSIASDLRGQTG